MNDADDADKALECAEKILSNTVRYELFAANIAAGLIKGRIHNDGQDAENKRLSGYSPEYIPRRQRKGRQTTRKDLQMTDRLFNSEQVFKLGGSPVFGFVPGQRSDGSGLTNAELAGHLEAQEKRLIFQASDSEVDKIMDAVIAQVEKDFDECMK